MKKNRILCIATMLCGLLACHAQTNGYESLSVEAYEQTIADTSVVRLARAYRGRVCRGPHLQGREHRRA